MPAGFAKVLSFDNLAHVKTGRLFSSKLSGLPQTIRYEMADTKIVDDALRDFKRSVEITRDVRFQANLRLGKRQRASSYIVSLLSLYVIALSLLPNIIVLKPFQNQILLSCSIVLSVFIIFTSLIDSSQNFYHRGELLHQCARKVASISHSLKNIDVAFDLEKAKIQLEDLQKEYRSALDSTLR